MRWAGALLGLAAMGGGAFAQMPERILPGFADLPLLTGDRLAEKTNGGDLVFVETPAHGYKLTEARTDEYIAALAAKGWRRVASRRGTVFRQDGGDGLMCIEVGSAMTTGVDAAAAEPTRYGVTFHRRACPTPESPN